MLAGPNGVGPLHSLRARGTPITPTTPSSNSTCKHKEQEGQRKDGSGRIRLASCPGRWCLIASSAAGSDARGMEAMTVLALMTRRGTGLGRVPAQCVGEGAGRTLAASTAAPKSAWNLNHSLNGELVPVLLAQDLQRHAHGGDPGKGYM